MTVGEIFEKFGEPYFRDGERRVIARLVDGTPKVIATGGGAFINDETRALILDQAIAIWLDAPPRVLAERVKRRDTRPLLRNRDPHQVLADLAAVRNPIYAQAPIRIASDQAPHESAVVAILKAIGWGTRHDRDPRVAGRPQLRRGDRARVARPRRRASGAARARAVDGDRQRRECRAASRDVAGRARRRRDRQRGDRAAAGRRHQELDAARNADRPLARARRRARRSCHRARRRRDRRPGRVRLLDRQARLRLRPGADHLARASRQLGRRQDRDQHARRQESDRRVPPAGAGADRPRRARHAAAARATRGLCRGRQIRPDRRFRVLRMVRGERRQSCSRATRRRANMPSRIRSPPRRGSSPRTSARRPASARCSTSAIPSATRWRPRPASPTNCSTAKRSRPGWRWPSPIRRGAACAPARTPSASPRTSARSACPMASRRRASPRAARRWSITCATTRRWTPAPCPSCSRAGSGGRSLTIRSIWLTWRRFWMRSGR